ncbi:MAG: chromosomal replication initiator protein DnaA [Dysgonamonadaceae bacterium]|jgi:chromosomal replication initiator protein|nr:chromosomal replication initiator protein DnaA [Dysgonamonadaceae bacterium]
MKSYVNLWNQCLEIIKDNVTDSVYNTWFTPIIPIKYEGNDFTIQVPSQFFYEYLEEKYADLIYQTLSRVINKGIILNYRIIVDNSNRNNGHTTLQSEHPAACDEDRRKVKGLNEAPADLGQSERDWNPNLNNRLCFHNFFEGSSNKLARSIALKIAQEPGKDFNPCFIHGCSGVGKTHLCHAIGNKIRELDPQKKVLYISAHLFEVQFTDARKKNTHNEFVHFYQGVDVLILDDIHELAGKEKTQQAYFHIFNHLKLIGKQLILTADRLPIEIQGLEERLISRLKWGLTLELQKPDLELRKKILQNKVKQDGLNISEEIIDYIAENVTDHVRDLEGIITSLVAYSLVYNREVSLELAKRVMSKTVKMEKKQITLEKIQNVVSSYFKIHINEIHSKSRKREIVQARQVAMFLSKKYTDYSYSHIGNIVGKRDHSTVLHACRAIQDNLDVDKGFRLTMKDIEALLQS